MCWSCTALHFVNNNEISNGLLHQNMISSNVKKDAFYSHTRRSPLQWFGNKSHLCPLHDHLEECYFSLSVEKYFSTLEENFIPLHSLEISSLYLHSVFKVNFLPWYIFQFTAMLLATSEDCKQKSLKRLAQDDDNVLTSARNSSFNKRAIFSTQRSHKPDNLKVIARWVDASIVSTFVLALHNSHQYCTTHPICLTERCKQKHFHWMFSRNTI